MKNDGWPSNLFLWLWWPLTALALLALADGRLTLAALVGIPMLAGVPLHLRAGNAQRRRERDERRARLIRVGMLWPGDEE